MKRVLLDTHIFLWWISNTEHHKLGPQAKDIIAQPTNDVYVSAASLWEISIKTRLGALTAPSDLESIIIQKGFTGLPISLFHAQQAGAIPEVLLPTTNKFHKDPFDRMLVAQAQAEGLELITCDSAFRAYGIRLVDGSR